MSYKVKDNYDAIDVNFSVWVLENREQKYFLLKHYNTMQSFDVTELLVCLYDGSALDGRKLKEVHFNDYFESWYTGMDIEELIYQAHMKGQFDVHGCDASYSNARADCQDIVKFIKEKEE